MPPRRKLIILLALVPALALALLFSCPTPPDSAPQAPGAKKQPAAAGLPNIVLILSDTTRADHLPFYGYAKNTTPYLASLAARGAVFESAWTTYPWTGPAMASLHSSLYPWQHGLLVGMMASRRRIEQEAGRAASINRIPLAVETIAERLASHGYTAFAVADNVNICPEEGFDQGFSRLETFQHLGADKVNDVVLSWEADMRASAPYFLYLHYNDAHAPYMARDPWYAKGATELEDYFARYDSSISFMDDNIRRLAERMGWNDETLIIMAADHGEEFWDHNRAGHGQALYNEVMRVPLFFHFPAGGVRASRFPQNVSLVDVYPTLLGLLGLKPNPAHEGLDLSPALRGGPPPPDDRHLFAIVAQEMLIHLDQSRDIRAVVHKNWKYQDHFEDGEMLFDLAADPMEKSNLIRQHPEIAARMLAEFKRAEADLKRLPREFSPLEMDEDLGRHLRDLGYVGK